MSKVTRSTVLLRLSITLFSMLVVCVLFEVYLRRTATHVIRKDLEDSGGILESNPEFLIDYSSGQRRLIPGAEVVIKNHFLSKRDVPISINSLGFRDEELAVPKPSDEFRILVLGDSITIADYLPAKETYPEILQAFLNRGAQRYQVINTGLGNIGLEEELSILKESGLQLEPDLVVVAFYLNDSRPPWGFSGEIGDRGWIRRHSLLVESLYRGIMQDQWKQDKYELRFGWIEAKNTLNWKEDLGDFKKLVGLATYDWGAAWAEDSWEKVRRHLQALRSLSEEHRFNVAVVTFPVTFQLETEVGDPEVFLPQTRMQEIADSFKWPQLDLLPKLKKLVSEGRTVEDLYLDHCHPSSMGHAVVAVDIYSFLEQEKQLVKD